MTVRVQCLSGAVRSILKVAVCLVVAAVTVMALSGLAGTTADALPGHPETSCLPDTPGNDPCAGAAGPIGENSANNDDDKTHSLNQPPGVIVPGRARHCWTAASAGIFGR